MNEYLNSISKFLPELILFLGIPSIVTIDLLFKNTKKISLYAAALFISAALIFLLAQSGTAPQKLFFGIIVTDPFAVFFKVLISISVLFVIYISSISHEIESNENNSTEFYLFILLISLGGFLMVSSVNLVMIYVSIEMVNVGIYFLTSIIKRSTRASEASLKNITFGIISSGFMFFGISVLFGITGTTDLYDISAFLSINSVNTITLLISILLILAGFCYKILSLPSYFTTPDIYEASPVPVSALISTAVLISGFGLVIRFFLTAFHNPVSTVQNPEIFNLIQSFPWYTIISILAILTITLTNLAALAQDNLKRLLAFISVSQAGYILLGLVSANPQGLTASLFSLLIYLVNTSGLFYCSILIINKYKTENIHSIKGLVCNSPLHAISFGIFLFSAAGFPLTSGFIGKFLILSSLFNNGYLLLVIVGTINMIISLYYVIKISKNIFFLTPFETNQNLKLTAAENFILLLLVIPAIFAGVYFTPLLKLAEYSTAILGLK